jgi:hypothetical protein
MDLHLQINIKLPIGPLLAASILSKSSSGRLVLVKRIHFHWLISWDIAYSRAAFDAVERTDTTVFSVILFHSNTGLPS